MSIGFALLFSLPSAEAAELKVDRYNTTEHTIALPEVSPKQWVDVIRGYAERDGWRLEWLDPQTGAVGAYEPSADRRAVNAAIWMGIEQFAGERRGTEYDLVVRASDAKKAPLIPVTVWMPGKKHLIVSAGGAIPAPPSGPSAKKLVARHGMAGFREDGASFSPRLTGVMDVALSLLSEREHAAVRDITLTRRGGKSPDSRGKWVNDAVYQVTDDRGAIVLYDEILQPTSRFTGPVTAPRHPATMTLIHELAHAIDDAPRRQLIRRFNATVEAFNRDAEASNAVVDRLNSTRADPAELAALEREQARLGEVQKDLERMRRELERMEPASSGFRKRFGAVTEYGATSDTEAFAEAFGLYHLDRNALQRISPAAVAWFDAEGHLGG